MKQQRGALTKTLQQAVAFRMGLERMRAYANVSSRAAIKRTMREVKGSNPIRWKFIRMMLWDVLQVKRREAAHGHC